MKRYLMLLAGLCAVMISPFARAEEWREALAKMPLATNVTELNRSNAVQTMIASLQSNSTVKAIIFMPGATDEFFMFRRASASLNKPSPTLLDAVEAITNQTFIRATFKPPFLLMNTVEDALEPLVDIRDPQTAAALGEKQCEEHFEFFDKDWDYVLPHLGKGLKVGLSPGLYDEASFHFYRPSFAAWHLTGLEGLRAVALASKTKYAIDTNVVYFQVDNRYMAPPPDMEHFRLK